MRNPRLFASDQLVRWCPGCGDYAVLASVQKVLAGMDIPREKYVFISGIGCSSRFPYYMNTYGFHGIHGRALPIATGVKCANPDLQVWVATGDGDALSIGGNHFVHALRRNVDLKVLLFNNRIYGLTKGQTSPTSEFGKKTKSTPWGSIEYPVNPVSLALASEATFVARAVAADVAGLTDILARAARHQGSVLVEIFQNCVVFNDGAWKDVEDKAIREDRVLRLRHGEPLVFGVERDKGIRLKGFDPEIVEFAKGEAPQDLVVHDEKADSPHLAYLLSKLDDSRFPIPVGVFRAVRRPTLHELMDDQIDKAGKLKPQDLQAVLSASEEAAS
ncbi:MAG TPA: 2-oxoacid:ferredoxin oxidoreductase subunit beta [Elusimicrobia bacterium]|nr:2-oxoacid:ferredoxin oxidoreductase subunit beta [Elusimicrobiota bacterium]HBT60942.1 2-oxoacid:ferredoxin oxidoreductase subunit beta [Elusimicrobiota bacterium]